MCLIDITPSLLSLGKRCMELGYRFVWEPFTHPKFYDPNGKRIAVEVISNIPYLVPPGKPRLWLGGPIFRASTRRSLHR